MIPLKSSLSIAVILSVTLPACQQQPAGPTAEDAAAACRTAIKLVLLDPQSAEFDPPTGAIQNVDGSWSVHRTLHAKNIFGGYLPTAYDCRVAPNGDGTWRGLEVTQVKP